MPTYQYACTACSERLEAVQTFTDAPLTECPACSGTLRKVFSAVGVVFKGSGFYKTDSRPAAKSESSGSSESKSTGEAKTSTTSGTSDSGSSGSSGSKPAAPAATSSTSAPASKSA